MCLDLAVFLLEEVGLLISLHNFDQLIHEWNNFCRNKHLLEYFTIFACISVISHAIFGVKLTTFFKSTEKQNEGRFHLQKTKVTTSEFLKFFFQISIFSNSYFFQYKFFSKFFQISIFFKYFFKSMEKQNEGHFHVQKNKVTTSEL